MFGPKFREGEVVHVTVDLRGSRFGGPIVLAETRGIVTQASGFMKDPIVEFTNGRSVVVPTRHLEHERVGLLASLLG
jgi:hypothetical protein